MRLALALLLLPALDDDRALRFYERTTFQKTEPQKDEERRVLQTLLRRECWIGAYRAIEERFAPFPETLTVAVDFDYAGDELARGFGKENEGQVRFNLRRLGEHQKKIDEINLQRKELEKEGKRLYYKVPPLRFDRIMYHELTHVLQRDYSAPDWFNEGMCQLAAEDNNCLCAFAVAGKKVESVDEPLAERADVYARGHVFWKWLAARGAVKKVVDLTIVKRRPWKESLEEATRLSWIDLTAAEKDWSTKEVDKLRK